MGLISQGLASNPANSASRLLSNSTFLFMLRSWAIHPAQRCGEIPCGKLPASTK
ncbi:Uncharacterised protein [Vibrio cholerae]|nr:Uncharacterised protein [Vibrio cholerae]